MYIRKCFVSLLAFTIINAYAQQSSFVAHSNSADATAYTNSHKIASGNEDLESDTIYVVYHSADTVYHTYTTDMGQSWQPSSAIHAGIYPALDVDAFGFRHVAWQYFDPGTNNYEIYYDCLDDWSPPQNISQSPTWVSTLPDLVVDSNNVIHLVWTEEVDGYNQIYYRIVWQNILGDTVRISNFGSNEATYTYPSISVFQPDNRVYAMWQCYDSLCYSPYQIHLRYKDNDTWSTTTSWAHYLSMRHPSFDYSHGQDTLSFCYEDSTSGNMEATFYGGNGGGLSTPGRSTYPVISTVGSTWSYLFWQEDSADQEDIYCQFYYFMSGWIAYSLRSLFNIQGPVRCPSTCGAYLIWTQGESAPYDIYFADFGYPIGIQETRHTQIITISAQPNPFSQMTDIRYLVRDEMYQTLAERSELKIYNSAGQLVKHLPPQAHGVNRLSSRRWYGDDNTGNEVPAGIYFCYMTAEIEDYLIKIVKVD